MTNAKDEKATKEMQPVLRLAGVNWVPHYTKPNFFVGPYTAYKVGCDPIFEDDEVKK